MITLRNITSKEQALLVGDGFLVKPYDEVVMDDEDAHIALKRYGDILEKVEVGNIGNTIELDKDAPVWVANVSGDPDAPEKVVVDIRRNKITQEMQEITAENYLAKPLPVTVRWRAKTKREQYRSSTIEIKPPKQRYTVQALERKPVDRQLANAMLKRSMEAGPGMQGRLIASRPPSSFEPDGSWSLDDMRAWLFVVDPRGYEKAMPPSEKWLRSNAKNKSAADRAVEKERITMLKRCFIRSANPSFQLPSRSEFERMLGRADVQQVLTDSTVDEIAINEQIVAAQTKPRGRPKKVQPEA